MNRPLATALVVGLPLVACRCADPAVYQEAQESGDSTSDGSTTADLSMSGPEPATETTEDPVDVSRFMGVFHNESDFIPFGREVEDIGDPTIANLEILPDGTAHMSMENCDPNQGLEISWFWVAHPGPRLELLPGPGEESLRFMALTGLESVYATLVGGCDLLFEIDGLPLGGEAFRPGRACWVNRCETFDNMVHIDYCDGEEPPPCE